MQKSMHVHTYSWVCMFRCGWHLQYNPPSARPFVPLMLKKTRLVNTQPWSGLQPWVCLCHISLCGQQNMFTGVSHILSSVCQEVQHIHQFFLHIKQRLFKHFCTSSPSRVHRSEKRGQEVCWKPKSLWIKQNIYIIFSHVTFYTRSFTNETNICIYLKLYLSLCFEFISTSAHVNMLINKFGLHLWTYTHCNQRVYSKLQCIRTPKHSPFSYCKETRVHNNNFHWCVKRNEL